MTKIMILYFIMLVVVAALAPMPKATPPQQPQPQWVTLPLDVALTLAAEGKIRILYYV